MAVVYRIEDDLANLKLKLTVKGNEYVIGWQQKLNQKDIFTCTADEICTESSTAMKVMARHGETPVQLVSLKAYPCGRLEMTPGFDKLVRLQEFEYVVENASGGVSDWLAAEAKEDAAKLEQWRNRITEALRPPAQHPEYDVGIVVELESAFDFDCDRLFIEYQVHLPRGWRALDGDWITTEDGASMCAGCTQVSHIKGDSDLAFGVVLALGLFFGLLVGPSYAVAFIFGPVLLAWSYGGLTQPDGMAHFNFPIVMHLKKDVDAPLTQAPCLYLHASSRRSFDRCVVEGYTHWRLPTTTTAGDVDLRTWRPLSTVRDQVQDFFVGGAHRLADLRYARYAPDDYDTKPRPVNSKYGFLAQTSGTIRLKGRVVTAKAKTPPTVVAKSEAEVMEKSRGRRIIDSILENLRSSLKTGELEWDPDESRLARDRALELIQKLRAERRDIRQYVMGAGVDDLVGGHPETKD